MGAHRQLGIGDSQIGRVVNGKSSAAKAFKFISSKENFKDNLLYK